MYKRGPLDLEENLTGDVLLPSNSRFYSLFSYGIVLNDYLVHSCWGLHLGSRLLQNGGSWSTHGLP